MVRFTIGAGGTAIEGELADSPEADEIADDFADGGRGIDPRHPSIQKLASSMTDMASPMEKA
ncbi:MAG: hypothetical protein EXR05_08835 [Acetobacteraceae bacterium]|nr:hypothetical protein [Acetobacteraceae bacterium]MSP29014.1 hypothetical protein [Acetobacteraceae bacterium]